MLLEFLEIHGASHGNELLMGKCKPYKFGLVSIVYIAKDIPQIKENEKAGIAPSFSRIEAALTASIPMPV